jgi:hypothetical protein
MEIYKRNHQVIDGSLDDNLVMMHLNKGKYFGLNPVGKRIWELIEQPKSLEDLTNILITEFDVNHEQCTQEVKAFLQKALACDIIVKA